MEGCAQGRRTRFVDGHSGETTQIGTAIEADVDQDGAPEVVALIDCVPPGWGEGSWGQVVVFRRGSDRAFDTIGLVVEAAGADDAIEHADVIAALFAIEITPRGDIRVEVGDGNATHTSEFLQGLHQQRTYGWNSTAFVQTAGSTTFVVPPGTFDLSVGTSAMTYAKPVDGSRTGSMTVTLRNNGATTVEDLSVQLAMEPGQADCADSGASSVPTCVVGLLAPDAARTVTFHHSIPACEAASECESGTDPNSRVNPWADLQVRIGDQKYSETRSLPVVFK